MCFYQKSRQLPRSPPTHQQATILVARATPCLHSKNRGSWGKRCLALSPRKEMGKRGLEWVWHDKSICHSPGSRRSYSSVIPMSSEHRLGLQVQLQLQTFSLLSSLLPHLSRLWYFASLPHPIHHTEWPQAQTYHIAMEPAFSEKFFNWLASRTVTQVSPGL